MNKLLFAIALLFLQVNCNCQSSEKNMDQYSCILDEVERNKREQYGKEFRQQLSDTLKHWIETVDNSFMRRYKRINYEISDYALFNKNHDKGIGFVIKHRLEGELLDFIDIIIGEMNEKGILEFYYTGVPSLSFDQYGDSAQRLKPVSKEVMERRVLETIIKDGYYSKGCKRDYQYFKKQWFPEWIKKKHRTEFYKPD